MDPLFIAINKNCDVWDELFFSFQSGTCQKTFENH